MSCSSKCDAQGDMFEIKLCSNRQMFEASGSAVVNVVAAVELCSRKLRSGERYQVERLR